MDANIYSPAAETFPTMVKRASTSCSRPTNELNTACLLKESFGQLWSYQTPGLARAFFERWKERLKWQRLEPYQKFAAMIERH